jgi:hypothetical protein
MFTHLTNRWGVAISNPDADDLKAALVELEVADQEHPDCWLSNEDEWTISGSETGLVVLENAEANEGPWHKHYTSHDEVLELWQLLRDGKLDDLKQLRWEPGYGQ